MNVSKRSLKGLDLGDSAKVLEKKMTFFFAQPRSPAGGVPWGGKNMSICRKNKKGLVFIHSGPFGASVWKKQAPCCFIANTPVFSTPGDPPGGGTGLQIFFWEFNRYLRQDWTSLDKFRRVWTSLDKFRQVWTDLDKFGQVWTSLDKFGQVWTSLDKFGQI